MGRERFLDVDRLNDWFPKRLTRKGGNGLERFEFDELRPLLYPSSELEYVRGFARANKQLVYEYACWSHQGAESRGIWWNQTSPS